tara:strand:- start:163 stop:468 length:306 start_codon:yes stop_codon:yes gene_type:complete
MKNRKNKMTFTKYNTKVNHLTTHEMVASKIKKGLTNETRIICEIGTILRDMGKNNTQVNYLMNVDNDFITNVLSCYDVPEKRKSVSSNNNLNPWINHPKKL